MSENKEKASVKLASRGDFSGLVFLENPMLLAFTACFSLSVHFLGGVMLIFIVALFSL